MKAPVCQCLLFITLALFFAFFPALLSPSFAIPEPGQEIRAVNFVFLIDVSGSMVSKKTMVSAADGSQITLFEALRQALRQIVEDERLIGPKSKLSFITFGTAVTEKSLWPDSLEDPAARQTLCENIASPTELQADKHGDTYMAGALDQAYRKALQMASAQEPCTGTFIVMLTDGWDEPPAGAKLNVRQMAAKFIAREKELRERLGVNTWQVRVVGLQRLPEFKSGTTTAAELARLLGGEFLDVTRLGNEPVADRIFLALKKTIAELKGQVELAAVDKGGLADFGLIEGGRQAEATIRLTSRSCYPETISSIEDVSRSLDDRRLEKLKLCLSALERKSPPEPSLKSSLGSPPGALPEGLEDLKSLLPAGQLSAGAISFQPVERDFLLIPTFEQLARGGVSWQPFKIAARVSSQCPPGYYLGAFKLVSTARVAELVPYIIKVPARLVVDSESIYSKVRKPGFFFTRPCKTELRFQVAARVAGHGKKMHEIAVEPLPAPSSTSAAGSASSTSAAGSSSAHASASQLLLLPTQINCGKEIILKLDESDQSGCPVIIPVDVPAEQQPGSYRGSLRLRVKDSSGTLAPADINYTLEILPSPWEQVRPVALPILFVLAALVCVGLFLTLAGLKRS